MAGCGGWYVLPRELSLSTGGTLLQHPAVELQQLRTGAAITSTSHLAAGGQVEVLVRLVTLVQIHLGTVVMEVQEQQMLIVLVQI